MCKMNFLVKHLLFCMCIVVSIVCFSCAGKNIEVPTWVTEPTAVYSDNIYLTAVGFGEDRTTAETTAVASLSKIIRQSVQATSTAKEEYVAVEDEWTENKQIESTVETKTDIIVSGISIQEVWEKVSGKSVEYYALAIMNREEAGRFYKEKAQSNTDVINELIDKANSEKGTFSSFSRLKKATEIAIENEFYLDVLSVVNSNMRRLLTPEYQSANSVKELANRALEAVKVAIYVKGDDNGRYAAAFAEVIQKYGIKTVTLKTKTSVSDASYLLQAEVVIDPVDISSTKKNKYARYVLDSSLIEGLTQKNVLAFNINGREAHLTEAEAIQRAIRTLEQAIKKDFGSKFESLFVE